MLILEKLRSTGQAHSRISGRRGIWFILRGPMENSTWALPWHRCHFWICCPWADTFEDPCHIPLAYLRSQPQLCWIVSSHPRTPVPFVLWKPLELMWPKCQAWTNRVRSQPPVSWIHNVRRLLLRSHGRIQAPLLFPSTSCPPHCLTLTYWDQE